MAINSRVGMFDIPNFLGGSSLLANQGLRSSGLGGSSGSLVADPFGGGGPQAREVGAPGTGLPGVVGLNDPCAQSMIATGQPTPCPPGQQHDPVGTCGPCIGIPMPGGELPTGLTGPDVPLELTTQPSSCPEPTSLNPGKPGSHTWNTATCTWDPREGVSPTKGDPKPLTAGQMIAGDIMGGSMQYGRGRGAQSRQQLGQFGRMGGGIGGGAMGNMELFENPLLAGGSPYLEKNVSQFAGGGRMKNPYKYADGGRADFMSGVRRGMNSAVAAGQIKEVVRNNRASRRFTSGGKF